MRIHIALSWRNERHPLAAALAVFAAGACGLWGQLLVDWLS